MSATNHTETETAHYFIENEIMHVIYKQGVTVELSHVKENLAARLSIQGGKKMLVLVDVTRAWDYTKEAREFAANKQVSAIALAYAIVTGKSVPIISIANFFIYFNKPTVPSKLFASREKAKEWLETKIAISN